MKKIIYLTLTLILISQIFVACKNSGEESQSSQDTPQATPTPEPEEDLDLDVDLFDEGEELSGTLVISSDKVNPNTTSYHGILPLVNGFKELHPNVEVIVEGYNHSDYAMSQEELEVLSEKYEQDMRIGLTTGDVPDLIFTGRDYTSSFATTDSLMNLNAFIQNDPTFNEDDFFMEIFDACEVYGKLYNMPNTVSFMYLRMREDVLNAAGVDPNTVETVDYKFLLDVYNKAKDSGKFPDLEGIGQNASEGKALLYRYEVTNAFNGKDMTASFTSPEFTQYLEITKQHDSPYAFGGFSGPIYDGVQAFLEDGYFVQNIIGLSYGTGEFLISELDGITKPIPVVTSSGELLITPGYNMSIPTNAKNPALAWEFIKYCIYESEEMPDGLDIAKLGKWGGNRFESDMPVNKNNMERIVSSHLAEFTEEEKDKLISLYQTSLSLPIVMRNLNAYLPVYDILREYYETDGMYTAEEVAKALQERAEIYLNEIA